MEDVYIKGSQKGRVFVRISYIRVLGSTGVCVKDELKTMRGLELWSELWVKNENMKKHKSLFGGSVPTPTWTSRVPRETTSNQALCGCGRVVVAAPSCNLAHCSDTLLWAPVTWSPHTLSLTCSCPPTGFLQGGQELAFEHLPR